MRIIKDGTFSTKGKPVWLGNCSCCNAEIEFEENELYAAGSLGVPGSAKVGVCCFCFTQMNVHRVLTPFLEHNEEG